MVKKFLLIVFFIIFFTHAAFAQEIFRVTSVNFDTSNSLIFLTSPDNTSESIMKNVKLIKLQNPKRVYFDINSAVLATASQNWYFNSGGVKQVKISQFSSNPSKIRVTLFLEDDFDSAKINFLRVNNNLVIKLKNNQNDICRNSYFQTIYNDEKTSSKDFYENLSISSEDIEKTNTTIKNIPNNEMLNQIQTAFTSKPQTIGNTVPVSIKKIEAVKKELKLKSKYYLNLITMKPNGFLISGFGAVSIEKPMYLTNPARVVFDIPNAIVNPEVRSQEYKLGQDVIKVSQFDSNKARIVITSNELEKYFPIFSADGQSILFLNSENIDVTTLFSKLNDAVSYYAKKINPKTDEFIIAFNSPVVHSVRRDGSKLTINFYNTLRYNEENFRYTVSQTNFHDMKIDLLPKVGLKLTLPLEKETVVSSYLGSDGKSVRVVVRGLPEYIPTSSAEKLLSLPKYGTIIIPKCNGKRSVVIDAGHGGSDYGAIRSGVSEKDINLDVARRVQAILQSKGVSVAMTRNTDDFVTLQDRTIFTTNTSPNIFVSIHVNSSSKQGISGIETHYYHPESLDLAQTVHSSLISYVKACDRGLFKSKFYVINHTCVPAILVEIGFISNDSERAELVTEDRKQKTAKAIADGIIKYLNKYK